MDTQTTPSQYPSPMPVTPAPMMHKPSHLRWLWVVVGLIAVSVVAAFAWMKFYPVPSTAPSPTPTTTTSAAPATSKKFTSPSYVYTFEYPSNWYLKQDDASGKVSVDTDPKPIYTGLEVPEHPDQVAFGTSIVVQQLPATSLQAFITSQQIANESYVASAYPGLLHRQGQVPGPSGRDSYLGYSNGFGVTITMYVSSGVTVSNQDVFAKVLSTFKFTTNPSAPLTQQQLNTIFDIAKKNADTKIFFSENLGVGFTYDPKPSTQSTITTTEIGNTIYVNEATNTNQPGSGQRVEVFTKDPALTLEQAIKARFLTGYNPMDCFPKAHPTNEQGLSNYVIAGISYPPPTDPNDPWFQNQDKCPRGYSETNALSYFLMNKDVPNRFIFVWVGQDSFTSDGSSPTPSGNFNWSHSIRILK